MNEVLRRVLTRRILLSAMILILSSCDGGIFGTGDGSVVSPSDSAGVGSPEPPAGTDSPNEGEDQPTPGVQPGDAEDDTQVELQAFENLQIGSNSNRPLIALVNASSIPLNVATLPESDISIDMPVQPDIASEYGSIALASTGLIVTHAADAEPLLVLSPLNLGAFSVTTLIARDRLAGNGNEAVVSERSQSAAEIIAIPSQRLPSDDGVARVRLVQAIALDETDQAASMRLTPAGGSPGGSEIDLGVTSAATYGMQLEYQLAAPGNYSLTDSLARLTPLPVELSSGQFYTLVLTGNPVTLLVLQDSQPSERNTSVVRQR